MGKGKEPNRCISNLQMPQFDAIDLSNALTENEITKLMKLTEDSKVILQYQVEKKSHTGTDRISVELARIRKHAYFTSLGLEWIHMPRQHFAVIY